MEHYRRQGRGWITVIEKEGNAWQSNDQCVLATTTNGRAADAEGAEE
jgi:hypothetical protein